MAGGASAPDAPTIAITPGDVGISGATQTDDTQPIIRVAFAGTGTPVVAGDTVNLTVDAVQQAAYTVLAGDVTNGFADVQVSSVLAAGAHPITATATNGSGTSPASNQLDAFVGGPSIAYDGFADGLKHIGGPAGAADGTVGFIALRYESIALDDTAMTFFEVKNANGVVLTVRRKADNTVEFLGFQGDAATAVFSNTTTGQLTTADGAFTIFAAFTGTTSHLVIARETGLLIGTAVVGTAGNIEWTSDWQFGKAVDGAEAVSGNVMTHFVDLAFNNPSLASVRNKFYGSGDMVSLGADGSTPFASVPIVCHEDPAVSHTRNKGSGGDADVGSTFENTVTTGLYVSAPAAAFAPELAGYRFYGSGTEAGSTPLAAQDVDTVVSANTVTVGQSPIDALQVRALIQEAGGADGAATDDWGLELSINGGAFGPPQTQSGNVYDRHFSFTDKNNGDPSTDRGTNGITGGSGSFVAGKVAENTDTISDVQITADDFTELGWSYRFLVQSFETFASGTTLDHRITLNGSPIAGLVPRMTIQNFEWDFDLFRFYEDGSEAGSTAIAAENTNIVRDPGTDPTCHLRGRIQETNSVPSSQASREHYQLLARKNGGAAFEVNASSSNVRAHTTSGLTDNGSTTSRLTSGAGSFVAGEQEEGNGRTDGPQITADDHSEIVFALELVDADLANNDTLDFELRRYEVVTQIDTGGTNSVVPRITISK